MTQGERIKQIRIALNLTQDKFGKRIGMKRNSISQIESGLNNVTEQTARAICREFSVNLEWLLNGKGEMFLETDNAIIATIDRIMASENEFHKNLFKGLSKLSEADLLALERIIDKFLDTKIFCNS
jgi:Predicted transcriptional regulators